MAEQVFTALDHWPVAGLRQRNVQHARDQREAVVKIDQAKLGALEAVLDSPGWIAGLVEELRAEPPETNLVWMRCAFPRQFDLAMFEQVLAEGAPSASFAQFTAAASVEPVPRQVGFFRPPAQPRE